MKRKILITGGLGHLGSYLIKNLPRRKNKIIVVDNLKTQRYCSLFNLGKNVSFIEKDFNSLDISDFDGVETVIHLAAITDAVSSFKNKEEIEKINIEGTKRFFSFLDEKTNVRRIIFPSSTSVYGKSKKIMKEDDDNILPQSPYAQAKREIEIFLQKEMKRIEYVIFRFGTIFGVSPGMRFHTAINTFCYNAAFGKDLIIWKENYMHFRPYLGLNDMMQAILIGLKNKFRREEKNIYNVITCNSETRDIVETIKALILDLSIKMVDTPLLNQNSYFVDIEKIEKMGFRPKDDLFFEIEKTLKVLRR